MSNAHVYTEMPLQAGLHPEVLMAIDKQSQDELRAEVEKVLMSLTPREAQAYRMMMNMKLINQTPEQEDEILKALLQELVAMKGNEP